MILRHAYVKANEDWPDDAPVRIGEPYLGNTLVHIGERDDEIALDIFWVEWS